VSRQTWFFSLDSVKSGLRILASDDVITLTGLPGGAAAPSGRRPGYPPLRSAEPGAAFPGETSRALHRPVQLAEVRR
jgi:hypothetical protein